MYRRTYVEVNLDNLNKNVRNIIQSFPGYKYYIGIVKGNAYGHGEYISKYIIQNGINYLAISSLEEAKQVRKYVSNDIPILCLEPISLDYIKEIIEYNVTISVCNLEYYKQLRELEINGVIKFHLKLNTGMNRLGISSLDDVNYIFNDVRNDNIVFEGIFTHFATDGVNDKLFLKQLDNFKYLTSEIDLSKIEIVHLGKSATLENHQKLDFCNGVRLGIMMYGVSSFSSDKESKKIEPIRSLSLCSEVVDVHKINSGETVGYGDSNVVLDDSYIAVLPVGYADGLQYNYKDWMVTINGKKYPVVGSVMMGMITVLVDNNVKVCDKVILFNHQDDYIELASKFNTIPYILMTNLHRDLPRVYIQNDEVVETIEI